MAKLIRLADGRFVGKLTKTGQRVAARYTWPAVHDQDQAHRFDETMSGDRRLMATLLRLNDGAALVTPDDIPPVIFGRREPIALWKRLVMAACLAGIALVLLGSLHAVPYPIPKRGQCPSGWATSGGYCQQPQGAKQCVPKQGQCPSGWRQSGDACCPS